MLRRMIEMAVEIDEWILFGEEGRLSFRDLLARLENVCAVEGVVRGIGSIEGICWPSLVH